VASHLRRTGTTNDGEGPWDEQIISIAEEANTVIASNTEFSPHFSKKFCFSAEARAVPGAGARRPGILVVDDDAAVRFLLDIGLRQYGFAVLQAADGQEAIQVYQQERADIDLVLLDIRMPGLDGPQTLAALLGLNPQVRCCFMTGHAGSYSQAELLQLGAECVFSKPFQLAELAQAIGKLMGHSLTQTSHP
jgi:CheY-like chemotaxis protein